MPDKTMDSWMVFLIRDFLIDIDSKVIDIVNESDYDGRQFLCKEFEDKHAILNLYLLQLEDGCHTFSWRYCFDKGLLSLQELGHFKHYLLRNGISEEEWQKEVEKNYSNIKKTKVKKYMKEYNEYREKHKYR